MKHKDYSEGKWRTSLGGVENGCIGQVTRLVFITLDRDKVGKATADRALIQDAPRLAEENERLREAATQALRVLSHIKDSPKADPLKYIPVSAYVKAYDTLKAALAEKGAGE